MEEDISQFSSSVDYSTVLDNFNGPLDLLLHLVQEAKIEIRDIFVSQVTDQFIRYMEGLDRIDMDKASEYLDMAARLVEIKSRALLPQPDYDEEYADEDPQEELIRQLEEYKLFKEKAEELKEKEDVNRFYKPPEESATEVKLVYKDFNLEGLIDAFTRLMVRVEDRAKKNKIKEIPKDVYTVADKIGFIRTALLAKERCSFFELFEEDTGRMEVITTFQALLELLKLQYVHAEQQGTYGDIQIILREDRSEDLGDLSKELAEYN